MTRSVDSWQAPEHWHRIRTIDMHTGGEPLRVILDGFPELVGNTVLDYRRDISARYDYLRTALMFEPRGHADMYGVIVTPSETADFGVVFLHNEGYSTMCGHATIAITRLAIEAGWVEVSEPETRLTIEAPCGILHATAVVANGRASRMRFLNVPSYVVALDRQVAVAGLGNVHYDLAYGGAYYAVVDAEQLGISCTPGSYQRLIAAGMDIKRAVMAGADNIQHPYEAELSFLYGTIFVGGPVTAGVDSRNVCIFAAGELDRSPTGSGVSARLAIAHQRGELAVGDCMVIESILGTSFDCRIHAAVDYAGMPAVIAEVEGTAHVTGTHAFLIDPDDPLRDGFIFRS